jgi:enoyl-[acyl-carrier protein] reductase I
MGLLDGCCGLVVGIANERSLAYAIAEMARSQGATLAVTYQNERLRGRVEGLAESLRAEIVAPLDVADDAQLDALRDRIATGWGRLDFVVHSVAFAQRHELEGRCVDTSRDGFALAMDISVYSLIALARRFEELLAQSSRSPSLLTLSYYGAEKAIPNYNVMGVAKAALEAAVRYLAADLGPKGVRVNAVSAGPVKTLSAAGIRGMRRMLAEARRSTPLRRNIDAAEVAKAALLALSELGSAVTGEVYHVDGGYHALGALAADDG